MKKPFWLYILVLVIVIMAILFWHRPIRLPAGMQEVSQQTNLSVTTASATSQVFSNAPVSMASPVNIQSLSTSNTGVPPGFQQHIESKNSPIDFFGQVIDQDGNTLSDVHVKVAVRHWYVPVPDVMDEEGKTIRLETASDAGGRFEISGATGDAFDLESITKAGYEVEPTKRSFGPSEGSFANPVIFKMWNTNIHEQLITGQKTFKIVPDGRPYFINLTTGTINESGEGDLRVWIQYTNQVVHGQLYDCSSEVDVVNGGLLEEDDLNASMYSAPTNGYTSSFQIQQQIKGGQYGLTGEKRFYVMLENGEEYGRIRINLFAPYTDQIPGLIRLSYVINPGGSRILR